MDLCFLLIDFALLCFAQDSGPLSGLSTLHSGVTSERASSWNRTCGNRDALVINGGDTATMAEVSGAGEIRHIWVTVASRSPNYLRELVLRMYRDGETDPGIRLSPIRSSTLCRL